MPKVVRLKTVTSLDLPANVVLEAAIDNLQDVVIVGYDKDGYEYFASSIADGGTVLWLLERIKKKLLDQVD